MKKLFLAANRLGIRQLLLICLFVGVSLGTLCSNLLKDYFMEQFFLFSDQFLGRITTMEMDPLTISEIAFIQYIKQFGLLVLLATTMLGVPYILFHCTYKGFCLGFILSTVVLRYGVKGIAFFLCYVSPQCLIYVPVLALTYIKAYRVNSGLYSRVGREQLQVGKYIPSLCLLALLLLAASLLEGYVNASLLRMVMVKLM